MISPESYDQRIVSRLEEFWASSPRWHRCLWNVGTTAAISELLEASESLPALALKAMQTEVERVVGPDPAVGDDVVRNALGKMLKEDLVFQRTNWHELSQFLNIIEYEYLKRWADLLRIASPPGLERVARSVASHLLHAGFSAEYLHRWLRYHVQYRPD